MVDLGHPLTVTDPTWDGTPAFSREGVATFDKDGYAAGRITVEEHFGTHVDAPAHFIDGAAKIEGDAGAELPHVRYRRSRRPD